MYDVAIIDGNNIFYKAFSVHQDFSVYNGTKEVFTGGTWGFLNSLISLKKEYNPSKIIVTWDRGHARRTEMYPAYKGNRDKSDVEFFENLYTQMNMCREVLNHLGVPQAFKDGEEADDVCGTLSRQYREEGKRVLIMSADKDYQQLIRDGIDLLAHKGKNNIKVWNDVDWSEMHGYYPSLFSITLGLMGDVGDNIPGVQGIGEKGASKLISENLDFLNVILENKVDPQGYAPKKETSAIKKLLMKPNQDLFRISYELAKIDRHLENVHIAEFPKDMDRVEDLFEMYQFHNLLKKANWEILEGI